jgi:MFS family permease
MKSLLKNKIILFIIASVFLSQCAIYLSSPALPSLQSSLHISANLAKDTLTVFLFGFSFSALVWGRIIDAIGNKYSFLIGFSLFGTASLCSAFSTHIYSLLFFRLLASVGAGSIPIASRALIRDTFDESVSVVAFSYLAAVLTLAPMIILPIGGYLTEYLQWQSNFTFQAVAALVIVVLIARLLPNNKPEKVQESWWQGSIRLFSTQEFEVNAILRGLLSAINLLYAAIAPFIFINLLHFSPKYYGWTGILLTLGFQLGLILARKLLLNLDKNVVIALGILISFVASLVLFLCSLLSLTKEASVFLILGCFLFIILGQGMLIPLCTARAMGAVRQTSGITASWLVFHQYIIGALLCYLASVMDIHSLVSFAALILGIAIFMLLLFAKAWVGKKSKLESIV